MKVLFMTVVGLFVLPFFWLLQKLGLAKPPPQLSPLFTDLTAHLFRSGVSVVGEMYSVPLTNVQEAATLTLGFSPTQLRVVTVTFSPTVEAAESVVAEARGSPQYTGVRRNGQLVMACTFNPPSTELEESVGNAFDSFMPRNSSEPGVRASP